jgi:hypothetical protein
MDNTKMTTKAQKVVNKAEINKPITPKLSTVNQNNSSALKAQPQKPLKKQNYAEEESD